MLSVTVSHNVTVFAIYRSIPCLEHLTQWCLKEYGGGALTLEQVTCH